MAVDNDQLKQIIEGAVYAAGEPVTIDRIKQLFPENEVPETQAIKDAVASLQDDYQDRGLALKEIASGYRFQVRESLSPWLIKLWEERAPRFSRAVLETLALIAYRQPVTRAEIEEVRGVTVSSHIVKSLLEREWIRVLGHRDVPGRPALLGTTKEFLDYFNLKSLDELPPLDELQDLEKIGEQFELQMDQTESDTAATASVDAETANAADIDANADEDTEHADDCDEVTAEIVDNDDIETDEEITAEDHETEPMTEALEETPSEWLEDVVDVAGVEEDTLESIEEVDAQDTEAETL
ncbi:MAG: SMC-Scp complex subunit ScpB [Legionellales bacterium]|nr:SMC-Scp complex subunit ScpB [Legionellales bacterium]|tara:strand:+ start:716 stop:1606 length:891 start_codon:yes stop_codon:yes gene_type:complete